MERAGSIKKSNKEDKEAKKQEKAEKKQEKLEAKRTESVKKIELKRQESCDAIKVKRLRWHGGAQLRHKKCGFDLRFLWYHGFNS